MAKQAPIRKYGGRLSPSQIAEGMNAAARNARRLVHDAKALFDSKSYPTACSLAVLAIEEAGKLTVLRALSVAPDEASMKAEWRNFRSHSAKNAMWIITDLAAKGARTLNDLRDIFAPDSDHPQVLDVVKQLGFYTDCYGEAHWSEPLAVVDEDLARRIIFTAEILVPKHETSGREIELWVEHVGSCWRTPSMLQGSIEFHRAMAREGMGRHSPEEIEAFYGVASAATSKPT